VHNYLIEGTQDNALCKINLKGENDIQIKRVIDYYRIDRISKRYCLCEFPLIHRARTTNETICG